MTKSSDVTWRTNRAAIFAVALVLATASAAAMCLQNSSIEDQATVHPSVVALRGSVVDAAQLASLPHPLLRAAMVVLPPTADEIAAMERLAAEKRCLAEAIYYEARGEGVQGQMAVAEVIFHRLHRHGYPGSICGVVYQGASDGNCQFSFACNTDLLRRKSWADWSRAKNLAAKIVTGLTRLGNSTDGATAFHAVDVEPDWSNNLERTVQIGNHIFYRPLPRTRAS